MKIKSTTNHGVTRFLLDLRSIGMGREYFSTRSDADQRVTEIKNYGTSANKFGHKERLAYLEAIDRLKPFGASVFDAVSFYVRNHSEIERRTLSYGVKEFLEAKEKSGKRKRYTQQLRYTLDDLRGEFGDETGVETIQKSQVEEWLDRDDWKSATRRSQFINCQTFFSFALARKWTTQNPCDKVEKIILDDKPPGILSVEECDALMRCAETDMPKLLPYLALCLFVGVRPSEILPHDDPKSTEDRPLPMLPGIVWSEIEIDRGFAEIKASKSKTRQRRLATLSENAKAWLRLGGDLPPTNWQDRLGAVRKTSGVAWSHDCLRHSFVSYALPIRGVAQTAMDAGHSESILFKHYRELVTKQDAERFWNIFPKLLNSTK